MLFGIAQLDKAGERKVLALRVADKAIIGEDAAQVGIALKQHAIHVIHFALQPARDRPNASNRGHGIGLVGGDMDANAMVLRDGKQAIHNFKARITIWPIDARNLHKLLIGEFVAEHHHAADQLLALHMQRDFAVRLFKR